MEAERSVRCRWVPAMAVVAVLLAVTPGLAGHAITGDWATAAVFSDTIHVLAMALWLGGLVVLAVVTLGRDATLQARDAVERFSRVALACIIALVVTGGFQTWRQVGSLDALRSTDFGRILVVKLVLVALVIVFAAFSREVVLRLLPRATRRGPRCRSSPADPTTTLVAAMTTTSTTSTCSSSCAACAAPSGPRSRPRC